MFLSLQIRLWDYLLALQDIPFTSLALEKHLSVRKYNLSISEMLGRGRILSSVPMQKTVMMVDLNRLICFVVDIQRFK